MSFFAFSFSNSDQLSTTGKTTSAPAIRVLPKTQKKIEQKNGIEVVIPGLGHVGSIPKLDFGLELIYGVNSATKDKAPKSDDTLYIRGELKSKF